MGMQDREKANGWTTEGEGDIAERPCKRLLRRPPSSPAHIRKSGRCKMNMLYSKQPSEPPSGINPLVNKQRRFGGTKTPSWRTEGAGQDAEAMNRVWMPLGLSGIAAAGHESLAWL